MIKMVGALLRRIYSSFATNILDVPPRLLAFLLLMVLLFLPVARLDLYILRIVTIALIFAIFAASWDLLVGRAGQVSLGHALFFGIGAYLSAYLSRFHGLPLWATIPLSMLFCALVAVLLGFPCLRVKGPYLTLVTMAFPLILAVGFFALDPPFGGEGGIALTRAQRLFPMEALYPQRVAEYYLILFLLLVSAIILYKIANSKTGIVLVSILDDESASKACGINVTRYKLLAWAISAFFAGLAGCLYAHYIQATPPTTVLGLTTSFYPVIMTILGGIGTIYGPIVGAFILWSLMEFTLWVLTDFFQFIPFIANAGDELRIIVYIGIIIVFIIKWPKGISKFVVEKLDELTEKRELDERKKK